MAELLNTLYVQTQGAVLRLEGDGVRIIVDRDTVARVPLLRLNGIAVFGNVTVTTFLIHRCAQDGRSIVWFSRGGRFRGRVQGAISGNVLLRRAQHLALDDLTDTLHIARQIVAAKIQNSRRVLLRSARDSDNATADGPMLRDTADRLAAILER